MATDTAQEPRASQHRSLGSLDLRPRTIVICLILPMILTAGVLGGLRLEALHTQEQEELQSLQHELKELDQAQGERIRNTQKLDQLRFRLEAKIDELQEQLKNQDGFLR